MENGKWQIKGHFVPIIQIPNIKHQMAKIYSIANIQYNKGYNANAVSKFAICHLQFTIFILRHK